MSRLTEYKNLHENPTGPGDARPTALQIIADEGVVGKLADKVILITGFSGGLGVETARALAKTGARLYLTVRNIEKGNKALQSLKQDDPTIDLSRLNLLEMELSSLESVRKAAKHFTAQSNQLNILINNAGISATPAEITQDGFEIQFAVNHLSHFLLFALLKPILESSSTTTFQSRVINLSSLAHRMSTVQTDDYNFSAAGYEPVAAYGQSKTANIWMANEIERRYGGKGIHALSVHPGGIETGLLDSHAPEIRPWMEAVLKEEYVAKRVKDAQQGSATTVLAAIGADFEGVGGLYLEDCGVSAPYDPNGHIASPGYAEWAFDLDGQKRLWNDSLGFVGLTDEAN